MKKTILSLLCLLLLAPLYAQQKQVAITVDDLPFAYAGKLSVSEVEQATRMLLDKFKRHGIVATGFVIGNGVNKEGETARWTALPEAWLKDGHGLGNHTYSHPSLSRASLEVYKADFLKNDTLLATLYGRYPQAVKYFRYPYLQMGKDTLRKNGFQRFLAEQGYHMAPVTIDNEDYIFNKVYVEAYLKKNEAGMKHAAQSYLRYLGSMVDYYDSLSVELLGRPIRQILLCHANLINAHYFDEVAELFIARGYSFISLGEALQDMSYNRGDTLLISGGWSHLDRWRRNDRLKSTLTSPQVAKDIMDAYEGR